MGRRTHLLIMTPERLDACTRRWRTHWNWITQVDLTVVDELHLLGEERRGPRLEGAISRLRRLNPFARILGLSATLGNRGELAAWLGGIHFGSSWRAVPISWRCVRFRKSSDKPALAAEEVGACVRSGGRSLIFVQSRRRAEQLAQYLCNEGVVAAHHHAGVGRDARAATESAFRDGSIEALVSTGTLEMGLNLPVLQVVLFDLQRFDGADSVPLSVNTVWQRAGRAGRRGLDESGEVVLVAPTWDKQAARYSSSGFDSVKSRLDRPDCLAEQLVAEVGSGLARTHEQLRRAMSHSLAGHQGRLGHFNHVVAEMIEAGMLVEKSDENSDKTFLRATRLGRMRPGALLQDHGAGHGEGDPAMDGPSPTSGEVDSRWRLSLTAPYVLQPLGNERSSSDLDSEADWPSKHADDHAVYASCRRGNPPGDCIAGRSERELPEHSRRAGAGRNRGDGDQA